MHKWYRVHRTLNRFARIGSRKLYRFLGVLSKLTFGIAAIFLAMVQFCDPQGQHLGSWLSPVAVYIHTHRFWIAFFIIAVQLVLQACIWITDRLQSPDVAKLESILDYVVTRHFAGQNKSQHTYRATLFKVRYCWLCGRWLGIVARSGTLYPQQTTVFCIDPKEKKHNTGIAGECWRQGGQTIITQLPQVGKNSSSPESNAEYKIEGRLDHREYELMNVKSTVLLATGIRVGGEVWGVLVLDTTDHEKYPKKRQHKRQREDLDFAAVALTQLVS